MSTFMSETNKLINQMNKECNKMINRLDQMVQEWTEKAVTIPLCEYLGMNDSQYRKYIYSPFNFLSSDKGIEWMSKFSFTKIGKEFTDEYTEEPKQLVSGN